MQPFTYLSVIMKRLSTDVKDSVYNVKVQTFFSVIACWFILVIVILNTLSPLSLLLADSKGASGL